MYYDPVFGNINTCPGAPILSAPTEFEGFAPLLEIVPTYAPAAPWSFRVPAAPEGMQAADRFDTYWGQLQNPIDLAQAHPMQCGYPEEAPSAGDYVEVVDPLPPPAVGTGYWYLTTVTYGGETRAGRRATNGELHGRDASVLPACVTPIQ